MSDFLHLPAAENDWTAWMTHRVQDQIAVAEATRAKLKDGEQRSTGEILELWNDGAIALHNAFAVTSLVSQVHPMRAVREVADELEQDLTRLMTDRGQDHELFAVLAGADRSELDAESARLLTHILRDFRRSGVDRDDAARERLRQISDRSTILDQEFSRGVRDDVRSIRVGAESLVGLPDDYIKDHPPGDDNLVEITTDYPDYVPFRTYARDAEARRSLTTEFLNRGWPSNDALLRELFDLRHEQATLLGYSGWPDFHAEDKMIRNGEAIAAFIERITKTANAPAHKDFDRMLKRARVDDPSITELTAADSMYYRELLSREEFAVDAQQVRRYFASDKVRAGLLEVTGQLFGVRYECAADAHPWHEDVAAFDVIRGDRRIGRIYLDLHPREGKYKHAAQFGIVPGVRDRQLPEGALVCNFPRGLMEHDQVTTLFHEFGHLLHHILGGEQHWVYFSGVATEWDFVEAPSQMLEEWAWDAEVLRTFARDESGTPIPTELVTAMRTADEFGKGFLARVQMFYARVSYVFHRDRPADLTAALKTLQSEYDMFSYMPGTHFHASFGHLTGYTSAYYTYMWSQVIAKDMFSGFDPTDLMNAEVAGRYRDRVLAKGGSADAADLVADFLDRPYDFTAFEAWLAS